VPGLHCAAVQRKAPIDALLDVVLQDDVACSYTTVRLASRRPLWVAPVRDGLLLADNVESPASRARVDP